MLTLRPLRPVDADIEFQFVSNLSPETRQNRLLGGARAITREYIEELTRVDFSRDMAIAATTMIGDEETLIGVARYARDKKGDAAEFAIVVADAWQGRGVGGQLLEALIAAAQAGGVTRLYGDILATNQRMLAFVRRHGFVLSRNPDDATLSRATLEF